MKYATITRNASTIRRIVKRNASAELGFIKKGDGTFTARNITLNPATLADFTTGGGERKTNPRTHFLFGSLDDNAFRSALVENIVYILTPRTVYTFADSADLLTD